MSHPIDPKEIYVIIPAYNEHSVIQRVIDELLPYNYSLVLIDDGSLPDLSPLLKGKKLYYLRHRVNLGQGAALQTGLEFSILKKAACIVTFDADGQHSPRDIALLAEAVAEKKADIILGSRFIEGAVHNMTAKRKMTIQLARFLNYLFTGLLLTDAHNGLRAMSASAAEKIHISENGMSHATEFLSQIKKNGLTYLELPVHVEYTPYSRKKGQTIWGSFRIVFDILLNKIFK